MLESIESQTGALTQRARKLRREQTDAEGRLWRHLRNRRLMGEKFRRQHPIHPYIVDFVCLARKLVIELDGGQHAERRKAYDRKRDDYLRRQGFRVLRFWNNDVLGNLDGVLGRIRRELESATPGS